MATNKAKSEDEQEQEGGWLQDIIGGEEDAEEREARLTEEKDEERGEESPEPETPEKDVSQELREKEPASEPVVEDDKKPAQAEDKAQEKAKIERGAVEALHKLRVKNQELRAQNANLQAQIPTAPPVLQQPLPGQTPGPTDHLPASLPGDKIPVTMDEEGNYHLDPNHIRGYLQQLAMENAPPPQARAQQEFERVRDDFVREDPGARQPVVQRLTMATEHLQLLSERVEQQLGYTPNGWKEWEPALKASGALDEFNEHYPEITDLGRFAHAVFGGDNTFLRYYAEDYMAANPTGELPVPGGDQEVSRETPGSQSNVRQLTPNRPRSMAQKGVSGKDDQDDEARFHQLEEEAESDVFGLTMDSKDRAELKRLQKKLGFDE